MMCGVAVHECDKAKEKRKKKKRSVSENHLLFCYFHHFSLVLSEKE
jgi:hypothetical protein